MVSKEDVMKALDKVYDPELNISVTELNLIEEVNIKDGNVEVIYRATTPLCPPFFAIKISMDMKEEIKKIKDVKKVKILLKDHFMSDEINRQVNQES